MKDFKLSIITVCFNSEGTIEKTINSVLDNAKTCNFDVEYIIVDGGSTDGTIALASELLKCNPESMTTKIISEPDNGIYDAMNKGLSLAKGDFIGIINSDDHYLPSIFLEIGKTIDEINNVDILHSSIINRYDDGRTDYIRKPMKIERIYEGMIINHPSVFVRKDVYEKLCFDLNYKYIADWVFITKVYELGYRFYEYKGPSCVFSMEGVSNKFIPVRHKEIFSLYFEFYEKKTLSKSLLMHLLLKQSLSFILDFIKAKFPLFYRFSLLVRKRK
ncbi:glycosyltransferase [Vibrio parahaemolyticus]|uniref:glycosyltransferase family 2 protein n=1 Tax=Vibrio parahaemolyticus TaxID=670 RepID=UPI00215C5188|nr:glycosyltransferase family 2 protein [Vibrio parahaemolyticus]MCS0012956.1 glycosyltransferase [Vibrio parahaemolyticus]